MLNPGFSPEYKQHIASPEWAVTRLEIFRRAKGRCERPGCFRLAKHVHHKTYVHLGAELPEELEALCLECHQAEHPLREITGPPQPKPLPPPLTPKKRHQKGSRRCSECAKRFKTELACIAHRRDMHLYPRPPKRPRPPKTDPEARLVHQGTKRLCPACDRPFWATRVVHPCPKCGTLVRSHLK